MIFDNTLSFLIHLPLKSLCLQLPICQFEEGNNHGHGLFPPNWEQLFLSSFFAALSHFQVSLSSVVGCSDLSGCPDQTGPPGTLKQVGRGTRATKLGSLPDPCSAQLESCLFGGFQPSLILAQLLRPRCLDGLFRAKLMSSILL